MWYTNDRDELTPEANHTVGIIAQTLATHGIMQSEYIVKFAKLSGCITFEFARTIETYVVLGYLQTRLPNNKFTMHKQEIFLE